VRDDHERGRSGEGSPDIVDNVKGIVVRQGAGTTIRRNMLAGQEQAAVYVGAFEDSDPTGTVVITNTAGR
jgi:hypothetical protein